MLFELFALLFLLFILTASRSRRGDLAAGFLAGCYFVRLSAWLLAHHAPLWLLQLIIPWR